jgi:hypothetical protein
MVVEQRIGRIQRLASEYANVVVYNITLRGTFVRVWSIADAIVGTATFLQRRYIHTTIDRKMLWIVLSATAGRDGHRELI